MGRILLTLAGCILVGSVGFLCVFVSFLRDLSLLADEAEQKQYGGGL